MSRLINTWTDDHILCAEVRLGLPDATVETINLWWCGWEGLAAAEYADESPRAKAVLDELIKEQQKVNKEFPNDAT